MGDNGVIPCADRIHSLFELADAVHRQVLHQHEGQDDDYAHNDQEAGDDLHDTLDLGRKKIGAD